MPPPGRIWKNQEGITLVEILVVMFLFVLIAGFSLNFLLMGLTGHAKAQANLEVQEQARLAMQRLVYEIRRAQDLDPASDFDVNLASSPGYSLVLNFTDSALEPTVFRVMGGVLHLKQGSRDAVALTADSVEIADLTFSNRSTPNGRSRHLQITLILKHPDPRGNVSAAIFHTLSSSVELRRLN